MHVNLKVKISTRKIKFEVIGTQMMFKVLGRTKERAVWSSLLRNTTEGAEPTRRPGLWRRRKTRRVQCHEA